MTENIIFHFDTMNPDFPYTNPININPTNIDIQRDFNNTAFDHTTFDTTFGISTLPNAESTNDGLTNDGLTNAESTNAESTNINTPTDIPSTDIPSINIPTELISYNPMYKIDNTIVNSYVDYLEKNIIINHEYTNKMVSLIRNILTSDSVNYNYKYLKELIDVFNIFYSSKTYLNYKMDLKIVNNNSDDSNNEKILIHRLLCFSFIIKILSDEENDYSSITSEYNISKFITDNIVLNNESPHFPVLISFINISGSLGSHLFSTDNNYGLVYDYIKPWSIFIRSSEKEVHDLNRLLQLLYANRFNLTQDYIYDVLESIIFQIIYSLNVLAKYRITHNDLRPSNIMIQGGYETNSNMYDHYQINNQYQTLNYYVKNMGFRVKIIDFGLSSSDLIDGLMSPKSKSHELTDRAGIYQEFSQYYDIHYFINDLLCRNVLNKICPKIDDLLCQIVNDKYIGNKSNIYINEYWRLTFPYMIKDFIKTKTDYFGHIELKYSSDNKLIVDHTLIHAFKIYLNITTNINTNAETFRKILNMISDPLDNNPDYILTPIEAIQLFNNLKMKPYSDLQISNKYVLNNI
jgi:hypothetical protein